MPWVYKITEIATATASGGTYISVDIWRSRGAEARGDPPHIVSEQLMNLKPVRQRAVRDGDGNYLRESGVFASPNAPPNEADPVVKEDVTIDVVAEMEGYVKDFIRTAVRINMPDDPGDNPSGIARSNADPRGLLARTDMKAAKGRKREFTP